MPGVLSDTGARVLEGLVLQAVRGKAEGIAEGEESRLIGGNEVDERGAKPYVAVQPEASVHGVDHSFASQKEFAAPFGEKKGPQTRVAPAGIGVLRNQWERRLDRFVDGHTG